MKKLFFILAGISILLILSAYILIPSTITINQHRTIAASEANTLKFIGKTDGWKVWWPGEIVPAENSKSTYLLNGFRFEIVKVNFSSVNLRIENKPDKLDSQLSYNFISRDSVIINWVTRIQTGNNPLQRFEKYRNAVELSRSIKSTLETLKTFMEDDKKIYGIEVKMHKVKYENYLTTEEISNEYPTMDMVYKLIYQLRNHAKKHGAKELDKPMLNIDSLAGKRFLIKVAIPVDREIPSSSGILINHMFKGNILVTQVEGGPRTVKESFKKLETFVNDKGYNSPAIPFESLVTDRIAQSDTSKWITRIYYPVY